MYFQLNELLRWLGLTAFEIFTALICFLAFSILVTVKVRLDGFPVQCLENAKIRQGLMAIIWSCNFTW